MAVYNSAPEDALTLLCIAVAHLNQAFSRKVPDRDRALLAAFSFFQVPRQCAGHGLCSILPSEMEIRSIFFCAQTTCCAAVQGNPQMHPSKLILRLLRCSCKYNEAV